VPDQASEMMGRKENERMRKRDNGRRVNERVGGRENGKMRVNLMKYRKENL